MTISLKHEVIIAALMKGRVSPTKGKKLNRVPPLDEAKAMHDIECAVSNFEKRELDYRHPRDAKKRYKQYHALHANLRGTYTKLRAILNTPGMIDPFVWAWWKDEKANEWDGTDRADIEAIVRNKLKNIGGLGRWVKLSSEVAKPARGRPRGSQLQRLIYALGRIYLEHTGSEPAYFRKRYIRTNKETSGQAEGPFLDFICTIASSCNIRRCKREGVASALDELKKTEEWHVQLHETEPEIRTAAQLTADELAMDEMQQTLSGRRGNARGKLKNNLDLYDA